MNTRWIAISSISILIIISGCIIPSGKIISEDKPIAQKISNLSDTTNTSISETLPESTEMSSCSPVYLNEKRCYDNWLQQKYQYRDCSIGWIEVEYCDYGCENGRCLSQQCVSGYLNNYRCSDNWKQRQYQYSDCNVSWINIESCQYGCENGICKQGCNEVFLNEYGCSGDWKTRKYQYSDCGFDWVFYEACSYGCENGTCNNQSEAITVTIVKDGDSIILENGEEVRLIGINAPETGEPCYQESKNTLKNMIEGKNIRLERDVTDKDQYDRLLRYVYLGDIFVNAEMVRLGYAHAYEYPPDTKYSNQFIAAENEAKKACRCIWQPCDSGKNYTQDKCFYTDLSMFHYNAAGDDNYNLNDEYATMKNKCSYTIDMNGWTIKDNTASHIYTFPQFTIQGGSTFTLYSGIGTNTPTKLYWGRSSGQYAAIWNNGGDTLYLRDKEGNLVFYYSY